MKKTIYSVLAILTVGFCSAQTSLTQAEYFWDNDPGVGLATAVQATDGTFNGAFEQLTKSGIIAPSAGLHKFCIRVKDNTGQWGPVFINVVNVEQPNTSPIMAVLQAEYFWDTDPGEGNGTAVLASDGTFDSAFEQLSKTGIALPAVGLHVFNVRVKDNTGTWGPVFRNVVSVQTNLGNTDFDLNSLTVYPNPVKNTLNFSYAQDITAVTVYNFLGQQVLSKSLQVNESSIDLSGLTSGTYYLTIQSQEKAKTVKIIKE